MSLYEIAFSGQLLPGAKLEQVEANLTRLFQADAQRMAQTATTNIQNVARQAQDAVTNPGNKDKDKA